MGKMTPFAGEREGREFGPKQSGPVLPQPESSRAATAMLSSPHGSSQLVTNKGEQLFGDYDNRGLL